MRFLFVILALLAAPAAAQDYRVEVLARGLENPWAIAFLPNGDALITERPGRLRVFANGALRAEPVAGVPQVYASGQGGLLDIALAPDFATTGEIYLTMAAQTEGGALTRLVRARYVDGRLIDATTLLDATPARSGGRHFGSRLAFGADGLLYMTTGERGNDPRAQRTDDLAGKVLRLARDGKPAPGNPFLGRSGYRPEIYSYGHRNPQGLAFDGATLWSVEHGPQGGDEINIVKPALNYGWPVVTHGRQYGSGAQIGEGVSKPGMEAPIHTWGPTSPATSGLAIYRGDAFPAWRGDLLVGMLREGAIRRVTIRDGRVTGEQKLAEGTASRIRDVRVGPDGYVYFVSDERNGVFARLMPAR